LAIRVRRGHLGQVGGGKRRVAFKPEPAHEQPGGDRQLLWVTGFGWRWRQNLRVGGLCEECERQKQTEANVEAQPAIWRHQPLSASRWARTRPVRWAARPGPAR